MKCKEIKFEDKLYPQRLKTILNPPKILYVLGNEQILNSECLSIVGSRDCSEKGASIARKFAREISKKRSNNSKWNGFRYR